MAATSKMALDSTSPRKPAISFFDLPREIRDKIYSLSITASETVRQHRVGTATGPYLSGYTRKVQSRRAHLPNIALTCKTVRREFACIAIPKHEIFAPLTQLAHFRPVYFGGSQSCESVTIYLHGFIDQHSMEHVAAAIGRLTLAIQHADIHLKFVSLEGERVGEAPRPLMGPSPHVQVLYWALDRMAPRRNGTKGSVAFLQRAGGRGKAALEEIGAYPSADEDDD